jgi:hypothetical protein
MSKANRHGGILLNTAVSLKRGELNTPSVSYFSKRKTAALKFSYFKTAAWYVICIFGAENLTAKTVVFFIYRMANAFSN